MRGRFSLFFLLSTGFALGWGGCKTQPSAIPASTWKALNASVSGALISTAAFGVPGGICHPGQPNYDAALCPQFQEEWFRSWDPIVSHPVHNDYQNFNNDSCWPFPELGLQCTPLLGYPTYVVNATTPHQVSTAIQFAQKNNVRLIVKSSGHDFRGRSVGGNSLSIWVHHMRGLALKTFRPCGGPSGGPPVEAITWAAGESALTKFNFAHSHGLMMNVGGGPSVSTGYALGGGHSIISATHGLAADNILEVNIVTPDGRFVTANSCQNRDLFWAVRGGGGSTFGVVLNITERAYPETQLSYVGALITGFSPNSSINTFYKATADFLHSWPTIGDAGIMAYSTLLPGNATTQPIFEVEFLGVNMTVAQSQAVLSPILTALNETYLPQGFIVLTNTTQYSKLYDFWINNLDDNGSVTPIGTDAMLGSRLLDGPALTRPDLATQLQAACGQGASFYLVSGPGVHRLPGNYNAVNPSWRTSYVHASEFSSAYSVNH
jgi:hypothetical protein